MTTFTFQNAHPKATRGLKSLIATYERTLTSEELASFLKHVSSLIEQYKLELGLAAPGEARAHKLHHLLEAEILRSSEIAVSCQKGCSSCCHLEVEVTNDEGVLLADIVRRGHKINFEFLKSQAERERQGEEWKNGATLENRCVFLDPAGSCSIYLDRPASCRRHAVTSAKEICADRHGTPTVRKIPMADVLFTAMLETDGTSFSSLSKMLVSELSKQTQSFDIQKTLDSLDFADPQILNLLGPNEP